MEQKTHWVTASFLVLGNCLGAGVLAYPVLAGLSGFVPALSVLLLMWAMMLVPSWVILFHANKEKNDTHDIPSLFKHTLGARTRWIAILCNLLLLYGLLTAYLTLIDSLVHALLHNWLEAVQIPEFVLILIYFALATTLIGLGKEVLRKGNSIIIAVIWLSFFGMIVFGSAEFSPTDLGYMNWRLSIASLPLALVTFHYQNILPTVARVLEYNPRATRKAVLTGTLMGLFINIVWMTIVLATLPEKGPYGQSLQEAFWHELPATVPMQITLESRWFTGFNLLFTLFAVTAAYIANGAALFGFIRDLASRHFHNRWVLGGMAFLPPLVISLTYPNILLRALDLVGGVFVAILFLILPLFMLRSVTASQLPVPKQILRASFVLGCIIVVYVVSSKVGWIDLFPSHPDGGRANTVRHGLMTSF